MDVAIARKLGRSGVERRRVKANTIIVDIEKDLVGSNLI
jgi:hypothetical protein